MSFDDLPDLGPAFTPAGEAYSTWSLEESKAAARDLNCILDIPYGSDFFQKLDLWLPETLAPGKLPVLFYVHGGGWTRGYKEQNGFMARQVLRFPAILVSPNHRLAPTVRYPAPLDDVISALAWVHRNIAAYGGDPDRIFVGGHSSGGHLAGLATVRRDLVSAAGMPSDVVKACFPLSAPLDLRLDHCEPGSRREGLIRDFLERDDQDREASVPEYAARLATPMLLAWGSVDFAEVMNHNQMMTQAMASVGYRGFASMVLDGADHTGTHRLWALPDHAYTSKVRDWMMGAAAL